MTKLYLNLIVSLLIVFNVSIAFAEEVGLLSYSSKEMTQGDLVKLKVIDSRNKYYFNKYKNKRIGSLLYVVDVVNHDNELYFEAIVSELGPKEKIPKLDDKFVIKGINYKPTQRKQLMDFITLDVPIHLTKKISSYIYVLILLFIVGIFVFYFKTKKSRMHKKRLAQRKSEKIKMLKKIIKNRSTPKEIATIYLQRKEIIKYFEVDEQIFNKTMSLINEVQYMRSWPDSKLKSIQKNLNSSLETVVEKRGI